MCYNKFIMEENINSQVPEEQSTPVEETPKADLSPTGSEGPPPADDRKVTTWIIVGVVVVLLLLIGMVVVLANQPVEATGHIRDIFIIMMALEFLVIGAALVVLIVQLAILINLLQNEIQPIVKSTNETVSTLRGTVTFLSDNLTEPVIKINEYLAGVKKATDILRLWKK